MFMHRYETLVRRAVMLFLGIVVALMTVQNFVFLVRNAWEELSHMERVADMQEAAMHAMAGALLVMLGLELLETMRAQAGDHRLRMELILATTLIGIGRHLLLLDLHHADGPQLVGTAALVAALAVGCWLLRRPTSPEPARATT